MGVTGTARSVVDRARDQKITYLAAGIAYYAFFSIIPLVLLVLAVGSLLGGQALANRLVSLVGDQLSSQGQMVISEALTDSTGRGGASIVGLVALLWSGLKLFRAVDIAFDVVYLTGADTSLVEQIVNGVITLAAIGLSVVVMVGLGTVISSADVIDVPGAGVLGWVGLFVGLVLVFLPVFYVMPPVEVSVREIVPGTIVTVIGWLLLQAGFQFYAANAGQYQAYGLIGAVLLFLTWLYVAGVVVLLGATINAVLAGR